MKVLLKLVAHTLINGLALFLARQHIPGFVFTDSYEALIAGAFVLTLLYTLLRPILTFISLPLIWLTLGIFHIVISILLFWIADYILVDLTVLTTTTLIEVGILFGIINSFFSL